MVSGRRRAPPAVLVASTELTDICSAAALRARMPACPRPCAVTALPGANVQAGEIGTVESEEGGKWKVTGVGKSRDGK